ncbi:MAG TPA: sigma-54 dependent transcriptional regulator [Thermoanaerobaculaceae bacterium]|nr:sigma-54 dependent transcriptional regulator [Thermoanaerobaculaceae bacterium]
MERDKTDPRTASDTPPASILLVEDDGELRAALRELLVAEGSAVVEASTAAGALAEFGRLDLDVVLLDLGLPDMDGLALLSRLRGLDDQAVVVVLTGRGDIETVVQAMKLGAENFLVKPTDAESLLAAVARGIQVRRLRRRDVAAVEELRRRGAVVPVGSSRAMRQVRELAERVAQTDASVVVLGESGTGKGMVAQMIHHLSRRARGPFTDLHCAALPPQLLESELFGHERGAFTDARERKVGLLEVAHGGTLFLDEIAEMDPIVQGKLLKTLEDRRFRRLGGVRDLTADVRLIAATHRDLRSEVEAGRFRHDLYYRLNVFQIVCPPLRSRREDIEEIAAHLIAILNPLLGRRIARVDPHAAQLLRAYPWPGNVRELRNVVERAMILASGEEITPEHLSADIHHPDASPTADALGSLAAAEAAHIRRVVAATGGNLKRAAEILEIARSTLYAKLRELGDPPAR